MKRAATLLLVLLSVAGLAMAQYPDSSNTDLNATFSWARIIRPNNTAVYVAGDAVNDSSSPLNILYFPMVARSAGGAVYLTGVYLKTNSATITNGRFRLYLLSDTIAAVADTAQFPLRWTDETKLIDYVDLVLTTGGTGSTMSWATRSGLAILCNTRKWGLTETYQYRQIYGVLTAQDAYTPAAYQQFDVIIKFSRQ